MRKIIAFSHISLDGFASRLNGEIDWIVYNSELVQYAKTLTDAADAAIYGRITYFWMSSYWPSIPANPESTAEEIHHAEWANNAQKIVLSRSLEKADWENTQIIRENVADEIGKLKAQPGKDMLIFGSPLTTHLLAELGLVDEYKLTISPVALGEGVPIFGKTPMQLKLVNTKTFECGVVGVHYEVVR